MSKANRLKLTQIADEALAQVDQGIEHLAQLEALLGAIRLDAEHNQGRRVVELVEVAEYLALDASNCLDIRAEELKGLLEAARPAQ